MDSLTVKGVSVLDENSRHISLLGGKIRTASPGEFVISGLIAFLAHLFCIRKFAWSIAQRAERTKYLNYKKQTLISK